MLLDTYIHEYGEIFDPSNYRLDHINRWDSDYDCTPVSLDEANQGLKPTGFNVDDIFAAELEKNRLQAEKSLQQNKSVALI